MRLDATEFGLGGVEHHGIDAEFGEQFDEVGAGFADELVGEEITVADNDTEDGAGSGHKKEKGQLGTRRDQEKFVAGVDGSKMRRGILPPNVAFVMG